MEKQTNLKAKNTPQLWIFLLANVLIIAVICFPAHFEKLTDKIDIIFILKYLSASIAPLLLFLLNGLISSRQKAILVFWKFKNPLPGSEAFSKLSKDDPRIDRAKLKQMYGPLSKSPKEQNKLWYKIYKRNSANIIVSDSHRAFLLARDLTSLSVLFVVFLGGAAFIIGKWPMNFYYFIYLLIQYAIVVIGAQNRGRRFVTNVLAVESGF